MVIWLEWGSYMLHRAGVGLLHGTYGWSGALTWCIELEWGSYVVHMAGVGLLHGTYGWSGALTWCIGLDYTFLSCVGICGVSHCCVGVARRVA